MNECNDCEYDCRWCEIYNSGEKLRHYMAREKEEPEKTKEAAINYLKTLPLTNKEWLATISEDEVYETMKWLFNTYGPTFESLRKGITEWLKKKH